MWRTRRLGSEIAVHAPRDQLPESGSTALPLLPEEAAKAAADPFIEFVEYVGRFAEAEVAPPPGQISFQRTNYLADAAPRLRWVSSRKRSSRLLKLGAV